MSETLKTLKCAGCGAGLPLRSGDVNLQCEYCNVVTRRVSKGEPASDVIMEKVQRVADFLTESRQKEKYALALDLIRKSRYTAAMDILTQILAEDDKQARAWFYKSLLPVLEQESILFHGTYVNLGIVSKLKTSDEIYAYLKRIKVPFYRRRAFVKWYRSNDFLYEQQIKYIDKAIEHGNEMEKDFFIQQRETMARDKRRKVRRRRFENALLFGLLAKVTIGATIAVLWYITSR